MISPEEQWLAVTWADVLWYTFSISPKVKEILQHVASWPEEDQDELAEYAREIEARRTGVYHATPSRQQPLRAFGRSQSHSPHD